MLPALFHTSIFRKCTVVLLVACLAVQFTGQFMMVALYEINKRYIAQTYCKHSANRDNRCAGKCYLRQQMRKNDCKRNPCHNAPAKKANAEVMDCLLPVDSSATVFAPAGKTPQVPVVRQLHARLMPCSVFQPPRLAAQVV